MRRTAGEGGPGPPGTPGRPALCGVRLASRQLDDQVWSELQPQAFRPELLCGPGTPAVPVRPGDPSLTPAGPGWFTAGPGTSVSHLLGRNWKSKREESQALGR